MPLNSMCSTVKPAQSDTHCDMKNVSDYAKRDKN